AVRLRPDAKPAQRPLEVRSPDTSGPTCVRGFTRRTAPLQQDAKTLPDPSCQLGDLGADRFAPFDRPLDLPPTCLETALQTSLARAIVMSMPRGMLRRMLYGA